MLLLILTMQAYVTGVKRWLINYLNLCLYGNPISPFFTIKNDVWITPQDQVLKEIIDTTTHPILSTKISKYVIPIAFKG